MDYKALRIELGFTQQEIADHIEVSRAAWAQYEAQTSRPKPETAWKIIDLAALHRKRLKLEDVYPRD